MTRDLAHWQPRPLPEPMVLDGHYARLEPLDPQRHADGLFAALMTGQAESDHRYLFETTMSRTDFQRWIEAKAQRRDILCHVVVDRASGLIGGRQDYMRAEPAHGVIEVGSIHWGPAIRRSRVATEALFLHADHALRALGYRRYEWKCHNNNEPSKRAARRFGFSFEGVFRRHMVHKGRNRDTAWFSILDEEWPRLRTGFLNGLDASNFDRSGQQKQSLCACGVRPGADVQAEQPVNRRAEGG